MRWVALVALADEGGNQHASLMRWVAIVAIAIAGTAVGSRVRRR
jgi:hypothetical protein